MAVRHVDISGQSSDIDDHFARTSERTFTVWSDVTDDENAVRSGLSTSGGYALAIYNTHPTDSQQLVVKAAVSLVEIGTNPDDGLEGKQWMAKVTYGPWNPLEHTPDGNPINEPVKFRFEPMNVPVPIFLDINGNPITNTAGDYYDPPIEGDRLVAVLTVTRNEVSPNLVTILGLSNKLNAASWNGFPAKCVKSQPIKLPERLWSQEAQILYYPMEYVFDIDLIGFQKMVLNQGFRQVVTIGGTMKFLQILDDASQPLSTPGFLDVHGAYLKPPITASNIIVNAYDIYETTDFSAFDLDGLFS